MSLTFEDLQAIRSIVEETVNPISSELEALSNDVKEIYQMLADNENASESRVSEKLDIERKLLQIHSDLVKAAKQVGITLPSH